MNIRDGLDQLSVVDASARRHVLLSEGKFVFDTFTIEYFDGVRAIPWNQQRDMREDVGTHPDMDEPATVDVDTNLKMDS